MLSQKAVTVYFLIKQLVPFGFAEQYCTYIIAQVRALYISLWWTLCSDYKCDIAGNLQADKHAWLQYLSLWL